MTTPRRISPFVTAKLRAIDADLAQAIPRVLDAADDEAIHDLRVAIRRLRTMLKLVRKVFGRFHTDAVRRAFTEVQRATGDLRDEEVLEEMLDDAGVEHPSFREWRARRRNIERRLRRRVVADLRKGDLVRARRMLKALLDLPVKPKRDRDLAKFARKCVGLARNDVERRRDVSTDDVEGLHRLRIAYKELRYTCELFAGALPADFAALAEPAARFQKRLGEIHDADVAILTAIRARALDPDAREALLSRLHEIRKKRVTKYLGEMAPAGANQTAEQIRAPRISRVLAVSQDATTTATAVPGGGATPRRRRNP